MNRIFGLFLFLIFTSACTGTSSSVIAPTLIASTATIAISNVSATVEPAATGFVYHVAMRIAETGGASAASFSVVTIVFPDGRASVATLTTVPTTIAAGTAQDMGTIDFVDATGTAVEPTVAVSVTYADSAHRVATATSSAAKVVPLAAQ